jgi:hypothetical protein
MRGNHLRPDPDSIIGSPVMRESVNSRDESQTRPAVESQPKSGAVNFLAMACIRINSDGLSVAGALFQWYTVD